MCNHKYKHSFTTTDICEWSSFFAEIFKQTTVKNIKYPNLPIDKDGYCIFHSKDLLWKRENDFVQRLTELIYLLNDSVYEDIALVDFVMVGNLSLEDDDYEEHKYHIESDNKDIMYFTHTWCEKHFRIQHATFVDPIILKKCYFKYDLIIDNCVFQNSLSIKHIVIGTDLLIENTPFNKNLVVNVKNRILGNFTIIDSRFLGRTNISDIIIEDHSVINGCYFGETTDYTNFNCAFDGGLNFTRNEFGHLCFDHCFFMGDSTFEDLKQKQSWQIYQPIIMGKIAFAGNENDLLFNSKTTIELTPDCFEEMGHIIFDYCNIKDLGTAFVTNVKELELMELVEIHPSCQVDRLTVVYEYQPYSNLKANIIEDFVNIITRYFGRWHSVNLTVNIYRERKKSKIKIVFKTTDNLTDEEFNRIMRNFYTTIVNIDKNKENNEVEDIKYSYEILLNRLFKNVNTIGIDGVKNILSLQGHINVNIEKIMIMGDEFKINNSQIGILSTGDNSTIEGNSPVINRTTSGNINYGTLSEELQALIRTLLREHDIDRKYIEILESAVDSAKEEDMNKVIEKLKMLPKNIFGFVQNIGAGILANFISHHHLGI